MVKLIDNFLNSITMYRLVLYGLLILAVIAILFGFLQILPFSGISMLATLTMLFIGMYLGQEVFKRIFHVGVNVESYQITILILFLILAPSLKQEDLLITLLAGIFAASSKFLLAIDKKHLFNPAAIAVLLIGLFGFGNAIWWVGSTVLLPFVLVLGLLVVRKIRRFHLLFTFSAVALLIISINNVIHGMTLPSAFLIIFTSWPLIFFGTIMLTEPYTTPPTKKLYIAYAAIVGVLFSLQFQFGPIFSSPELALVLGNIFSYIVSPKFRLSLAFISKKEIAPNIYEFVFNKPTFFTFKAGQYLEWTLIHAKSDMRGVRRYFTIASSPTDNTLKLGVKVDPNSSSSFKKNLLQLQPGDKLTAGQLAGDFTLPIDSSKKLTFIAGGIGITPFRSMIAYMVDKKEKRDVALFYSTTKMEEFVYGSLFTKAQDIGLKVVYAASNMQKDQENIHKGRIDQQIIEKHTPDFKDRMYYLSGPNAMVESYKKMLLDAKVSRNSIITDYFPGF